ncbi:MAG: polymerase sporulation sigma factor SigK, partial [Pseudomonadota bacterium]
LAETAQREDSRFRSGEIDITVLDQRLDQIGSAILSIQSLRDARLITTAALTAYQRIMLERSGDGCCGDIERYRLERLNAVEAEIAPLIDTFISRNLRLVYAIAGKFNAAEDLREDLVGAGNLTLLRCAREFKASLGFRFSTYAYRSIEHAMIGVAAAHRAERLHGAFGGEATGRQRRTISLSGRIGEEDGAVELIDLIPDSSAAAPLSEVSRREERSLSARMINAAFRELAPIEREVLTRYYGVGGAERRPVSSIAAELGLSREKARQCLSKAELRIRRFLEDDSPNELESLGLSSRHEVDLRPLTGPQAARTPDLPEKTPPLATPLSPTRRSPQAPLLPPNKRFFDAIERYTESLSLIRRDSPPTAEAPSSRSAATIVLLSEFHYELVQRWPAGHPERRYGFQLEGEMLSRKNLSATQISALEAAMRGLTGILTELSPHAPRARVLKRSESPPPLSENGAAAPSPSAND